MLITNDLDSSAMKELAVRFRQHRVSSNISQKELEEKTGVSLKTIQRFEKGEEIRLLTFIKLMQGVDLEHNLEGMIPDYTKRPSYIAAQSSLSDYKWPKRARKESDNIDSEWKWGDEE